MDGNVKMEELEVIEHQNLKMLEFQLKTGTGHIIPLHGINVNFSIIFTRADTTV